MHFFSIIIHSLSVSHNNYSKSFVFFFLLFPTQHSRSSTLTSIDFAFPFCQSFLLFLHSTLAFKLQCYLETKTCIQKSRAEYSSLTHSLFHEQNKILHTHACMHCNCMALQVCVCVLVLLVFRREIMFIHEKIKWIHCLLGWCVCCNSKTKREREREKENKSPLWEISHLPKCKQTNKAGNTISLVRLTCQTAEQMFIKFACFGEGEKSKRIERT